MDPQTFRVIVNAFSSGVLLLATAFAAISVWLMCRPRVITEASWVRPDFRRNSRVPVHRISVRVLFLVAAFAGMSAGSAVLRGVFRDARFMPLMFWFGVAVFAVAGVFILCSIVIAVLRLLPRTRSLTEPFYEVRDDDQERDAERNETRLFLFAFVAISFLVIGIVFA